MGHESRDYRRKLFSPEIVRPLLRLQQGRVFERFMHSIRPDPGTRVLDLGVNPTPEDVRDYILESRYPWPSQITAAGVEAPGEAIERLLPDVSYVQVERGKSLPFAEDAFDVVFSSAVVEHVGDRQAQAGFIAEMVRVAPTVFFTTPYRWYPLELHTLVPLVHYLPHPVYRRVYRRLGLDFFADEQNLNLLSRSSLRPLLPDGVRADIRLLDFGGPPSNMLVTLRR